MMASQTFGREDLPVFCRCRCPSEWTGLCSGRRSATREQFPQTAREASGILSNSVFREFPPVSDDELSASRGGFLTVNGIDFDFGANVQTLVNGQLALQTSVQWNPTGATVQQTLGSQANIVAIPSSQLNALFGTNNGIVANGVQITAPTGSIEVAANVAGSQVQNLVVNSASNQSNLAEYSRDARDIQFCSLATAVSPHAIANQLANEALAPALGISQPINS